MLCWQVLKLDNNEIETVRGFPALVSLTSLSLQNNKISQTEDMKLLKVCPKLVEVKLGGNLADEGQLMRAFLD